MSMMTSPNASTTRNASPTDADASKGAMTLKGLVRNVAKGVFACMPHWMPEFLYTKVLKPKPLRAPTNWLLRRMIPEQVDLDGVTIALNPIDPIVSGALTLNVYEKLETDYLRSVIKPGMNIVDVGANIGYYTAQFAQATGEQGRVIAIEPAPINQQFLKRTIELNGFENVAVHPVALSAEEGEVDLHLSSDNFGDHRIYNSGKADRGRKTVRVRTTTLEQILQEENIDRVDLIKIDIQGAEVLALPGMTSTLAANENVIMLTEFWPEGMRRAGGDAMQFLTTLADELNMNIHRLTDGTPALEPVTDLDALIESLPGREYTNLVVSRQSLA